MNVLARTATKTVIKKQMPVSRMWKTFKNRAVEWTTGEAQSKYHHSED